MSFIKLYWKQIVCSIVGSWFYLTSLALGVGGIVGHHLFGDAPFSVLDWVAVSLILFEAFPFLLSPASELFPLAIFLWLCKGWLLGFGICHWYRRSLRFESKWLAVRWWVCATSFLGCVTLLLITMAESLDMTSPEERSRAAYFCLWSLCLSSSLLIPLAIGLGYVGLLKRLLSTKQQAISEEREAKDSSTGM